MASDLPVDLLEDIFLRLDDAADLARASAACVAFHRVVSDGRFLRRFRSLHRRPILGLLADKKRHFETEIFFPAQPPRRSAQAAGGFAKAADFTFSFLPDSKRWRVCDVRDGRLLLIRGHRIYRKLSDLEVDLVVYDPLHRRHVQIPTIPGDLLQSAKQDGNGEAMKFDDPFLAPAAADEDQMDDDGEGFQVMFAALIALPSKTKVVAFVFSSASGQWRCVTSFTTGLSNYLCMDFECNPSVWLRQYVHGCVCWAHHFENVMLVFDTHEMKLSTAELPDESIGMSKMAVEAEDGRFGLLLLSDHGYTATMDLYSKPLKGIQEPQPDDEWRHESLISLTPGFELMLLHGAAEGYVLLLGLPKLEYRSDVCKEKRAAHYFTLELKTSLVEKLCVLEYDKQRRGFLYASFPPPFSTPSLCNCKNLSFSLPASTTDTCEDISLAELFC